MIRKELYFDGVTNPRNIKLEGPILYKKHLHLSCLQHPSIMNSTGWFLSGLPYWTIVFPNIYKG